MFKFIKKWFKIKNDACETFTIDCELNKVTHCIQKKNQRSIEHTDRYVKGYSNDHPLLIDEFDGYDPILDCADLSVSVVVDELNVRLRNAIKNKNLINPQIT